MKKLKGCLSIIGGLFVFLVVVAMFFPSEEKKSTETSSTTTEQNVTTESSSAAEGNTSSSEEETYSIGQVVKVGNVEYTVNSTSQASMVGSEYLGETAQGIFILVNVTVKNNGKESLTVSDSFFKLYQEDIEYESNSAASLYANDDNSFFLEEINPGNSVTSNVVFDVPQDVANAAGLKMQVQTGFWGTETAMIALQ